jgi:hypothetical protein
MSTTPDRTEEILNRHLDADFWCTSGQGGALSAKEVLALGRKWGYQLPTEFVVHSTGQFAGIYVEVKEALWPRPKPFAVGPFWSFLYGLFVYSVSADALEWMRIDSASREFKADSGKSALPCLKVIGDADIYVFDKRGTIAQWNHETGELKPFQGGFFDLLEYEIRELRQRKDQKVAGT